MSEPRTTSPLLARLVDDAALFPPARTPMANAVAAHRAHARSDHAGLVGPFLCPDTALPDLDAALRDLPDDAGPLPVGLVVSGGAGAIAPALTWAAGIERIRLAGVEVALRDEPPLSRNVARITLVLDHAGVADDVPVSVEIPRGEGFEGALNAVAATGHRAKLRTGGVTADAFPTERDVAGFIVACLDREVPFKCTAGLHHAVRSTSPEGFEQHGFLNLVLATRTALDGGGHGNVVRALAERNARGVAERVHALSQAAAESTRRWFCSFGSCSVSEPVDDLVALGFLQD